MNNDELWSTYFQNEAMLHAFRIELLPAEHQENYRRYLRLKDGMKILDIGCGTGEFTYYLGKLVKGCEFTGIDTDAGMIRAAVKRNHDAANKYLFAEGNAFHLPFADDTFDLVVSCTFLTAVGDVTGAVNEMKRVVKKGGRVAAVTAADFRAEVGSPGIWPKTVIHKVNEYAGLEQKAEQMYEAILPTNRKWTEPSGIPHLFARASLQNLQLHSFSNIFSLSDPLLCPDVKQDYINSYYQGMKMKLQKFWEIPEAKKYMTQREYERLLELNQWMQKYLLYHIKDNTSWNWSLNTLLFMSADKV